MMALTFLVITFELGMIEANGLQFRKEEILLGAQNDGLCGDAFLTPFGSLTLAAIRERNSSVTDLGKATTLQSSAG